MCNIITKPTMKEFLSWSKVFELSYAEFRSLAVGDRSTEYYLPPLKRREAVLASGLWGVLGVTVERMVKVAQPERVSVTFSRNATGVTEAMALAVPSGFHFAIGLSTLEKVTELAGVPMRHELPDAVVSQPPTPSWVYLGQGCSCGVGDCGSVSPRFRWEIVEELKKLNDEWHS